MTDGGLYDPDDPLARALFAAGRDEAPSSRTVEKALGGVGAATVTLSVAELARASATLMPQAATSGTLAGKAVASGTWVAFVKWTAVGMGTGIATIAAADGVQNWTAPKSDAASVVTGATEAPDPAARKAKPHELAVPRERSVREPKIAADPQVNSAAVSAAAARASDDALHAELAQVDRARAALASGRWGDDARSGGDRVARRPGTAADARIGSVQSACHLPDAPPPAAKQRDPRDQRSDGADVLARLTGPTGPSPFSPAARVSTRGPRLPAWPAPTRGSRP
jgi:hypothetical protein